MNHVTQTDHMVKIPVEEIHLMDSQTLINEIEKYPEYSLIERVMSFCDENEIDVNDIEDTLKASEHFKRVLYIDCVEKNTIMDKGLKRKLQETVKEEEW